MAYCKCITSKLLDEKCELNSFPEVQLPTCVSCYYKPLAYLYLMQKPFLKIYNSVVKVGLSNTEHMLPNIYVKHNSVLTVTINTNY